MATNEQKNLVQTKLLENQQIEKQIAELQKKKEENDKITAKLKKKVEKQHLGEEATLVLESLNSNETFKAYGYSASLKKSKTSFTFTVEKNESGISKKRSSSRTASNLNWDGNVRQVLADKIVKAQFYTKKALDDLCISCNANPGKFWKEPDGAKTMVKAENSKKAADYKKELKLKGLAKIYVKC